MPVGTPGRPLRRRRTRSSIVDRWKGIAVTAAPLIGVSAQVIGQSGAHEWALVALAGIVGLLVGSFLNVVVHRVPLGLSVSAPRSFCPTCDRQLAWWENVPVISWTALRGRCRTCHERISIRYPLVEGGTAVTFALVTWAWRGSSPSAGYCALAATAIAVSLIEFGGARAPLSVGAAGVGLGQLLLAVAAVWLGRWSLLGWSLTGLTLGGLALAGLRGADPDARDARFHGRTLLPTTGCWLGGIAGAGSVTGVVAGGAAWVLAEFGCLVVLWAVRNRGRPPALASAPLVTGTLVAMVVSLTVAG